MTACFEYFDERFDEVAFGNTNLKRRCGGIDRDWRKRGNVIHRIQYNIREYLGIQLDNINIIVQGVRILD